MTENGKNSENSDGKKESKGLCANCLNFKYCSYAKSVKKPVLFCEEHDLFQELAKKYDLDLRSKKKK